LRLLPTAFQGLQISQVSVPPGVDDGAILKIKGEGDSGVRGHESGDLFVELKVKPDDTFSRKDCNIYSEIIISYLDAILGAVKAVDVVDGKVSIAVPPGAQPEAVLKIPGRGSPRVDIPGMRGDHFVTLKVSIPTHVSAQEKTLLEQLRQMREIAE